MSQVEARGLRALLWVFGDSGDGVGGIAQQRAWDIRLAEAQGSDTTFRQVPKAKVTANVPGQLSLLDNE